ncbi:MAG TPA: type II toxin-antitoxin system Phd/YefM family antitoxin [Acidobacteriaceae bacterium]
MSSWGVAEAKAQFSEVVNKAMTEGPQEITRHGKDAVVLVSKAEWERRKRPRQNAAEFFMNSPLRGSGLKIERLRGKFRPVKF